MLLPPIACNGTRMELSSKVRVRVGVPYCGDSVEIKQLIECAEECLGWAETARTEQERGTFVGMAKAWLEAATSRFAAVSQPSPLASAPLGMTSSEQPANASIDDRSTVE